MVAQELCKGAASANWKAQPSCHGIKSLLLLTNSHWWKSERFLTLGQVFTVGLLPPAFRRLYSVPSSFDLRRCAASGTEDPHGTSIHALKGRSLLELESLGNSGSCGHGAGLPTAEELEGLFVVQLGQLLSLFLSLSDRLHTLQVDHLVF